MLNSDPKKLRFLGLSLRSRASRRWAVVLTYFVYFLAIISIYQLNGAVAEVRRYHTAFWLVLTVSLLFSLLFMFRGIFREDGP